MKKLYLLGSVLFVVLLMSTCATKTELPAPGEEVGAPAVGYSNTDLQPVAVVELGRIEAITVAQLKAEAKRRARVANQLDTRIDLKLVALSAEADPDTYSTVEQEIRQIRASLAMQAGYELTDEELDSFMLINTGMTLALYRDQLLAQVYLTKKAEQSSSELSEEEIYSTYEWSRANFVRPQSVRLSVIAVPFNSDRDQARERADQLSAAIHADPSVFDELAMTSPEGCEVMGDIGYVPRTAQAQQTFGSAFMRTVFDLQQGEVSSVIEGLTAYYIVKIIGTLDLKFLEFDDPAQLNTPVRLVSEEIQAALQQQENQHFMIQVRREVVEELRKDEHLYQRSVELVEQEVGDSPVDWNALLDEMIDERLLIQAAERDKLTVTMADVDRYIQQLQFSMAAQLGREPRTEEFAEEVMLETGMDMPSFREYIRRQLLIQRYMSSKQTDSPLAPPALVPISENEIEDYYNIARTNFVQPETLRYNAILVPFGADKEKTRETAEQLALEINKDSARFDAVFQRVSAPGSGFQVQENAYLPRVLQLRQSLGDAVADELFTLKPDQISSVFEVSAGYEILKAVALYDKQFLGLDDPVQLGGSLTVRDYIKDRLTQVQSTEHIQKDLVNDLRSIQGVYRIYKERIPVSEQKEEHNEAS
ncbi:MAG: peptidyl-prolyl cis-trans isomerase [Spirochaetaceae bacterium]|jgi:parvulin-like peptidyl-prolyl isomerase|nr:peptidyl-prolyl cis-trans isomerase [Spirochaetaceae bacterium]